MNELDKLEKAIKDNNLYGVLFDMGYVEKSIEELPKKQRNQILAGIENNKKGFDVRYCKIFCGLETFQKGKDVFFMSKGWIAKLKRQD